MKYLFLFIFILAVSSPAFSQKKSEVIQHGIEVQRQYEKDIKDGDKESTLIKEEFYDIKGDLVEVKEYKDKDVDKWFKYKYDFEANIIEEIELDSKGEQIERIVYKYNKGLRVEKLSYDEKNRLIKSRKYEYGYRK